MGRAAPTSGFGNSQAQVLVQPGDTQWIDVGTGPVDIRLTWTEGEAHQRNLADRLVGRDSMVGIDLDLGAFVELANGLKGVVQPLGQAFGAYDQVPFIQVAQTADRGNQGGEALRLNGSQLAQFRRLVIFACVPQGHPDWVSAQASCLIASGPQGLQIALDNAQNRHPLCVIATAEPDGQRLRVTKATSYHASHVDADRAYGVGLQWQ